MWRWQQEAEPGTPEANMATDAALLREVRDCADVLPIVRLYGWDRPCVTLGRLQDEALARATYPNLSLIRRPTGGRAVRHGGDLTVSVAARLCDLPHTEGTGVSASYRLITGGLAEAFHALGVPAEFGTVQGRSLTHPVDCFSMTSRCDLVDQRNGRKLAGCAQRREGGALLQQMSIPWANVPKRDAFVEALQASLTVRLEVSAWEVESASE